MKKKLGIFAVLIIVAGSVGLWYQNRNVTEPLPKLLSPEELKEEAKMAFNNLHVPELDKTVVSLLESKTVSPETLREKLDAAGFKMLYTSEKFTDAEAPFSVAIAPSVVAISEDLKKEGYTDGIGHMVILNTSSEIPVPVFRISPHVISGENGNALLSQVEAKFGYALKSSLTRADGVYKNPSRVFTLVMLDHIGNAASDELVIYWKPSEKGWRVTNTFGAPDTF